MLETFVGACWFASHGLQFQKTEDHFLFKVSMQHYGIIRSSNLTTFFLKNLRFLPSSSRTWLKQPAGFARFRAARQKGTAFQYSQQWNMAQALATLH